MNTIAELRAADTTKFVDGRNIYVSGYYAANDGGGGIFVYDEDSTATDDGGYVITPDNGSGRYLRTIGSEVDLRQWGAYGDYNHDDGAAIQACFDYFNDNQKAGVINVRGQFRSTIALSITAPVVLQGVRSKAPGSSPAMSAIVTATNSIDLLSIDYAHGVAIRDILFKTTATVRGNGIVVGGAGVSVSMVRIEDCTFTGFAIEIKFVNASIWNVTGCYFVGASSTTYGIHIDHVLLPDTGDSVIDKCVFDFTGATTYAINHVRSGGLRIVSNKFLGGERCYNLVITDPTTATSILIIANNTWENYTGHAVFLTAVAGGISWNNCTITGNQFTSVSGASAVTVNTAGVKGAALVGNEFNGAGNGSGTVRLVAATGWTIDANAFKDCLVGIGISGVTSSCLIGPSNLFYNCTVPILDSLGTGNEIQYRQYSQEFDAKNAGVVNGAATTIATLSSISTTGSNYGFVVLELESIGFCNARGGVAASSKWHIINEAGTFTLTQVSQTTTGAGGATLTHSLTETGGVVSIKLTDNGTATTSTYYTKIKAYGGGITAGILLRRAVYAES